MGRPMESLDPSLPAALIAFAEALRDASGCTPLRVVAEKSGISVASIGRYFRGTVVPPLRAARIVVEACGADWKDFEPLWVAARVDARRGDNPMAALALELNRLEAELTERIEWLESHLTALIDKGGRVMSTKKSYILIQKYPGGMIRHHPYELDSFLRATRAAGFMLHAAEAATESSGRRFADDLRQQPIGSIRTHHSGHAFRVLRADHTADGHAIVPGLRVINTDMWWGTVDADQFMAHGLSDPGGELFEGWYAIRREGDGHLKHYNGERLALKKPR